MQYHAANYADGVWDTFFFEKNIRGDIVAVYDANGTKLVSYVYDAWGNATVTYHNNGESTYAINNPFRYRGYYYDVDLGLYYLNSRYYDSNTCRFINADVYVSTGQGILGNNMFAYCNSNPVNYVDYGGNAASVISFGYDPRIKNPAENVGPAGAGGFLLGIGAAVAISASISKSATNKKNLVLPIILQICNLAFGP